MVKATGTKRIGDSKDDLIAELSVRVDELRRQQKITVTALKDIAESVGKDALDYDDLTTMAERALADLKLVKAKRRKERADA